MYIKDKIGSIIPSAEEQITISKMVFVELVKKVERIETVRRVYSTSGYICTDDILAILGIEKKEEDENA